LPLTVLAGVLFVNSTNVVREQAQARLLQLAQALSDNIDRDVERHVPVLHTLATLPSFQARDWPTFYNQARAALRGDGYIVVVDSSLRQLVNTYVPYGRHPPRTGDLETAQRILESRRVEASGVFTSLVTGGQVINIDVPILRNGRVVYIVMYGRPVAHVSRILEGQSLDPGWTSAVYDRNGALIASLAAPAQGEPVAPATRGVSRIADAAGNTILRATHVSELTGWTVTVDVPLSVVSAEVNRTLQWLVFSATAALLLAIAIAVLFGHFLSRQLGRAAAYARAMGREDAEPDLGATSLIEIREIADALQNARAQLGRRMSQQQLLSRELNHRVKNLLSVVQAVVSATLKAAPTARELVTQRLKALARSQDLLVRADWTGLSLRQIVEMEVAAFADRVAIEGPEVVVSSNNVQNFGLLLHELATNAVKHGALRGSAGTVAIGWRIEGGRFEFRWKEHCAGAVSPAGKAGFGTTLLTRAFAAPDSKHRLEVERDGLIYELDVALDTLGASAADASDGAGAAEAALQS
jgi:two-component sensor histidine kinase